MQCLATVDIGQSQDETWSPKHTTYFPSPDQGSSKSRIDTENFEVEQMGNRKVLSLKAQISYVRLDPLEVNNLVLFESETSG